MTNTGAEKALLPLSNIPRTMPSKSGNEYNSRDRHGDLAGTLPSLWGYDDALDRNSSIGQETPERERVRSRTPDTSHSPPLGNGMTRSPLGLSLTKKQRERPHGTPLFSAAPEQSVVSKDVI